MRLLSTRRVALVAVLALLPLSACDETGGLGDGPVDQQVRNAQIARQAGDYDTAIRILEAAYAANPSNAAVRVEYGLTVFERSDINLLDLDRIATYLSTTAVPRTGAEAPAAARGLTCRYATDPTATPFDPTDFADFPSLQGDRAQITLVLSLLEPIIPAALRSFDLCTSIVDGPDGNAALSYDAQAALADMRALGLTDDQISAALATNALARFLNAYLFLAIDVPQQTAWYRINGGSSIGICAEDEEALRTQAEVAIRDMGEALFSIDLRSRTFGTTSTTQDLLDLVLESYEEVRDGVGDYCSSN